jgi:sugar phosphate isomerase/epimerase
MDNPSKRFWVDFALNMGFNHLEFCEEIFLIADQISQIMMNHKVEAAIHAPYPYDYGFDLSSPPPRQEKATEFVDMVNKYAKHLQLSYVIFHPPNDPEPSRDILLDNLSKFKPMPLLENLFGSEGHKSWNEFAAFFEELNHSLNRRIGFCFDISHGNIAFGSKFLDLPAVLIDELASPHGYLHVHDGTRTDDLHRPLGRGEITWDPVFSFLKRIGFNGNLLLELIAKGEWTPKSHIKGVIESYLKVLAILPENERLAMISQFEQKKPIVQQYLKQL